MQRELEKHWKRKEEEEEEETAQMFKRIRTWSRRVWSCGNRFKGENCKKGFDKKRKTQINFCGILFFYGQFACYRNVREKGETWKKLLTLDNLQQKIPYSRNKNQ